MVKYVSYKESNMLDNRNVFVKLKEKLIDKKPFFSPTHINYLISKKDDQYFRVLKSRKNIRIFKDYKDKDYLVYSGSVNVKTINENNSLLTVCLESEILNQSSKTLSSNQHKYLEIC